MTDNTGYRMDPVVQQPGMPGGDKNAPEMMERPGNIPNCPPGLEYLTLLDQIVIKQQVELLEVLTGFETRNRYRMLNSMGQQCYFAKEDSACCHRQCCGGGRGFKMRITDNANQEVLLIDRPFKCCAGCCWFANTDCCSMELTIFDSQGQTCGHVRQQRSGCVPHYLLFDANMQELGRIRGICSRMCCPCCRDVPFPITTPDENVEIGEITKQWTGVVKEIFTDADTFCVTFPMDMDVRAKAVFVGAAFLIDFMYFENNNNNNN